MKIIVRNYSTVLHGRVDQAWVMIRFEGASDIQNAYRILANRASVTSPDDAVERIELIAQVAQLAGDNLEIIGECQVPSKLYEALMVWITETEGIWLKERWAMEMEWGKQLEISSMIWDAVRAQTPLDKEALEALTLTPDELAYVQRVYERSKSLFLSVLKDYTRSGGDRTDLLNSTDDVFGWIKASQKRGEW